MKKTDWWLLVSMAAFAVAIAIGVWIIVDRHFSKPTVQHDAHRIDTRAMGDCANMAWTSDGDFCYDAVLGRDYEIQGSCCDEARRRLGRPIHTPKPS